MQIQSGRTVPLNVPPAVAELKIREAVTLSQIFSKMGFSWIFLFIINLAGQQLYRAYMDEERSSKAEKGREGATLCFAYYSNEPIKTVARSTLVCSAAKKH